MGVRGLQKFLLRQTKALHRKKHGQQDNGLSSPTTREDEYSKGGEDVGHNGKEGEGPQPRRATANPPLDAGAVNYRCGEPKFIPRNSRLYVDALGFLYHLFGKQEEEESRRRRETLIADPPSSQKGLGEDASFFGYSTRREYGGSYRAFDSFARREIRRLQSLGVFESILFYFDGMMLQAKHATHEERALQKEQRWSNLYRYFCGRTSAPPAQEDIPMPPLIYEQFLRTLEAITHEEIDLEDQLSRLSISHATGGEEGEGKLSPSSPRSSTKICIVHCTVEADVEIARDVENWNKQSFPSSSEPSSRCGQAYCYGEDSDYLLMRGCPYIRFGHISGHHQPPPSSGNHSTNASGASDNSNQPDGVVAREVWRREEVAAMLNLTESQLVEWGILLGNDYTKEYSRSEFKVRKSLPQGLAHRNSNVESEGAGDVAIQLNNDSSYTIQEMLSIVQEGGDSFQLTSDNPEVQAAIALSRAIYEHQDSQWSLIMQELKKDQHINHDEKDLPSPLPGQNHVSTIAKSQDNGEEEEEISSSMFALTSNQRQCLESWAKDVAWKQIAMTQGVAWAVLHQLAKASNSTDEAKGSTAFSSVFTPTHLVAIETMLETIQSSLVLDPGEKLCRYDCESNDGDSLLQDLLSVTQHAPDKLVRPTWADFQAAHTYQLMLRHFFSSASTKSPRTRQISHPSAPFRDFLGHPQQFYEGEVFHKLMAGLHVNEDDDKACEQPMPASEEEKLVPGEAESLPIDSHREEILRKIRSDRVTIIHGETGCGKSSRLPVMLLQDANERGERCKIYISQPRRIAVTGLTRRLRPQLGKRVGMLMGHGIRDVFPETKVIFATTGYLVRLIAGNIGALRSATHLIVDEVHERSIDSDVICLLCKRILQDLPHIKIVLMSATIHTELYKEYFLGRDRGARSTSLKVANANSEVGDYADMDDSSEDSSEDDQDEYPGSEAYGDMKCLSVGVKRFPLNILYARDIARKIFHENVVVKQLCTSIETQTAKASVTAIPSDAIAKHQLRVAEELIRSHIAIGSGVLVFLPGLTSITELWDLLEADSRFSLSVVHSDVPFEEQVDIFSAVPEGKIKVVLATNAAESSITIPDVDYVICLGRGRAMCYNKASHQSVLTDIWISKASATQRAGRTGRVRPGTVFRLYSESLEKKFQEHDTPEVLRTTLEDVILQLLTMLEHADGFGGVFPILTQLIQPPDLSNVSRSLERLTKLDLIDESENLTSSGRFAGQMPVSLELSRLLLFGIVLGIPTEAVVLAAVLSVGKTPFRIAVPMIHTDVKEYNDIIRQSMTFADKVDNGCKSEPILWLKLVSKWLGMPNERAATAWAVRNGIAAKRLKQMSLVAKSLRLSVSRFLTHKPDVWSWRGSRQQKDKGKAYETSDDGYLRDFQSLYSLDGRTLNRLRLILTWTFADNLLCSKPTTEMAKFSKPLQRTAEEKKGQEWTGSACQLNLTDAAVSLEHLATLLPESRPGDYESYNGWKLERNVHRLHTAYLFKTNLDHILADLWSVCSELGIVMFWVMMDVQDVSVGEKEDHKGESKKKKAKNKELEGAARRTELRLVISREVAMETLLCPSESLEASEREGLERGGGSEPKVDQDTSLIRAAFATLAAELKLSETVPRLLPTKQGYEPFQPKSFATNSAQYIVFSGTSSIMLGKHEKLFKALSSKLPSSIALKIPANGKAQLICTNAHGITEDMLRRIFFFQGVEKRQKGEANSAQSLLQSLGTSDDIYDDTALFLGKDTVIDSATMSKSSVLAIAYRAPKRVGGGIDGRYPLVHDAPLGCRLIWSCMNGNLRRECRKLRLPALEKEAYDDALKSPARKECGRAEAKRSCSDMEVKVESASTRSTPEISTGVAPASLTWRHLGGITPCDSPVLKACSISRNSFCSVSVHLGRGPVFAVGTSSLIFHGGGLMFGEGITLLPPGCRWLSLALLCLGTQELHHTLLMPGCAGVKQVDDAEESFRDGVFDSPLNEDDLSLCNQVKEILLHAFPSTTEARTFTRNAALIDRIEKLFETWEDSYGYGQTAAVPDQENDGEEEMHEERPLAAEESQPLQSQRNNNRATATAQVTTDACPVAAPFPHRGNDNVIEHVLPTGDGLKRCPLCSESCSNISLLLKHMEDKSTHGLGKGQIAIALYGSLTKCSFCPSTKQKVYLQPLQLLNHLTSAVHAIPLAEAKESVANILSLKSGTAAERPVQAIYHSNAGEGTQKTVAVSETKALVAPVTRMAGPAVALALRQQQPSATARPHSVGRDNVNEPVLPTAGVLKRCPLCSLSFSTISPLVKHMKDKSIHGLKKRQVAIALYGSLTKCPICPSTKTKVYLKPLLLLNHLTSAKNHGMPLCEAEGIVAKVLSCATAAELPAQPTQLQAGEGIQRIPALSKKEAQQLTTPITANATPTPQYDQSPAPVVSEGGRDQVIEPVLPTAEGQKRCPLCSESYSTISLLLRHMKDKSTHGLKKGQIAIALYGSLTRCPVCPSTKTKVYLQPLRLLSHLTSAKHGTTASEAEGIVAKVLSMDSAQTAKAPSYIQPAGGEEETHGAANGDRPAPSHVKDPAPINEEFSNIKMLLEHTIDTHRIEPQTAAILLFGALTRCPVCPLAKQEIYPAPENLFAHLQSSAHDLAREEAKVVALKVFSLLHLRTETKSHDLTLSASSLPRTIPATTLACPFCPWKTARRDSPATKVLGTISCPRCSSKAKKKLYRAPYSLSSHLQSGVHKLPMDEADRIAQEMFSPYQ